MTQRYKASGKEVLRNFRHFADCIDPGAAQMIVDALNAADCTEATAQRDLPLADNGPLFNPQPGDKSHKEIGEYRFTPPLLVCSKCFHVREKYRECPNCPDTHSVRQENDEYACSCGKRWDVADGENHP